LEYPCHSPDAQGWFVGRVSRFEGEGDRRVVVTHENVTLRKEAEAALLKLNSELEQKVEARTLALDQARRDAEVASLAKSEFLAAMSHEIRTPMSGLLGLLEVLELSQLDDEQRSTLELARESGGALLSIISDILDFSKIEAKRFDLNVEACSIREVVERAYRLHSPIASNKNLVLQAAVAPEISPLLLADPLRLGQILNNFLSNAIKFTDQGRVDVRVELVERVGETERLRFVVQDTGIGISAQQLARLFQPFVQAGATAAKVEGTGLGLVIARRLAELMGGSVEIASEPGRGTTLTLTLAMKICDVDEGAAPAIRTRREMLAALVQGRRSAPSPQAAEAEGTLVLVVDDHPTNRQVLLQQLAALGYAAVAAADGVEALVLRGSHRFGAVISDCNMPHMNGYELSMEIRRLEQRSGAARVPIIACTANAMPEAVQRCHAAGMDDYVVKPANLADIGGKLARWLPLPDTSTSPTAPVAPLAAGAGAERAEGLFDHNLLAEISGGSASLQAELLVSFRRVNDRDAVDMRAAVAAQDFAVASKAAHRIKGASLTVGASSLAAASARVEAAAAAKDSAEVRAALGGFEQELLRLNEHLDSVYGGVAAPGG
jgi:signal transduction histidine kinase/CheY-like chemotaxis protein